MNEQTVEQKIEDAAEVFERIVEDSADRFDEKMNLIWDESRLFRWIAKGLSVAAELALVATAIRLAKRGYKTAALWCAGLGIVGLVISVAMALLFRRDTRE